MGLGQDRMGQDGRWGKQGGEPGSQGTDVGRSEQPAWRCHRRSQPAQVTVTHPSWKQARVDGSGPCWQSCLSPRFMGEEMQDQTCVHEGIGEEAEGTESWPGQW